MHTTETITSAYTSHYSFNTPIGRSDRVHCNWPMLRAQILLQWKRVKSADLDHASHSRRRLALLIQQEYGVASELIENYLCNVERCLPV